MSTGNVKLDMQIVSPSQASEWLSACSYEFQRRLKLGSVEYYAGEMLNGDFDTTTVLWIGRVNEGDWKLIDGQHRLAAVIKANTPQPFLVKRVTYTTENDLANAYARADQGIRRGQGDQARAWQLADRYGLPPTWVTTFAAGIKFIHGDFGWKRKLRTHPKELHSMMDDYSLAMTNFYASCSSSQRIMRKPLERAATVSVGLVTFRFSARIFGEDKVSSFWEGIAQDDGLRSGDARKTAHDHLLSTSMAYGIGRGKTVTAPYSARWLASCFNAWVKDKDRYDTKPDVSRPITILGSPFTGK